MPRNDYDEIRRNFDAFVGLLPQRERADLNQALRGIFTVDAKCYLSCAKAYADGSQHTVFGMEYFIRDMPAVDFFHRQVCNYYARLAGGQAQQIAHVVCLVGRYGDPAPLYARFDMMFANHWVRTDAGWRIDELRLDILPEDGNFEEFSSGWYFEDPHPKTYPGLHLPCINGELDSPWFRIPDGEDVLTEEEKVAEAFTRYAFGIDMLSFCEVEKIACEDVIADIQPWGPMDKRGWIAALKYHRQRDRLWGHCCQIQDLRIDGDTAYLHLYRLCGHKQREHPYVYTNENVDQAHACASYDLVLKREDGRWKIQKCCYYLGLIEMGPYQE